MAKSDVEISKEFSNQIVSDKQDTNLDSKENELNVSYLNSYTSARYIKIGGIGLPIHKFTLVLKNFYSFSKIYKKKCPKHPKRENFNAFIIRSIRKIFRFISKSIYPKSNTFGVDIKNPHQTRHWNELILIYNSNPKFAIELSKTENNPKKSNIMFETFGEYKKFNNHCINEKQNLLKSNHKSFNQEYCKIFFKNEIVEKAYMELIEIIFSDFYSEELCKRFNFSCCSKNNHDEGCFEKWIKLRLYLKNEYINDIIE